MDTEAEADAEADTGMDTEAEADAETDAGMDTEAEADAETDAGMDTEAEVDAGMDTEAEADAETDAGMDTEAEADAETDADMDIEAEADAETDADMSTEAEADAETDADMGIETDAGMGADIGDDSFGDSVFETIDLTDSGDQTVQFTVDRDASFENEVGFYEVNENGSVTDPISGEEIAIGETGYADAALANSLDLVLSTPNGQTTEFTTELSGGTQYGTFIVAEGTVEQLLDSDSNNDPAIYFGSASANSDNFDHVVSLGENTFGYEDFANGGDADFNDLVVSYEFV